MKPTLITRERELETLVTVCVALVVLWFYTKQEHVYLLYACISIGVLGLSSTFFSRKIALVWFRFAELLGSVMNKVILSLIFFVFLVPIAWIAKVFNSKDNSLQLKKPDADTYYFERHHKYESKDLENTW